MARVSNRSYGVEIYQMSDDGENILSIFRQARQVCEQVSLLLRTADEQMKKADWKNDNSTALSDLSYSINNPRQWIPTAVYSFYCNQKYPHYLACVSIMLSDQSDERYKIKEPIVTALIFDYGMAGEKFDWHYDYWYARYFGYLSKIKHLESNGQLIEFDNKKLEPDLSVRFEKGTMFAIPLVSLRNAQDVKSQITDKLLNLLIK
jgi:hypothetical protein